MSAPDSTPDDLVELGRIVSAFGVRGWVKLKPHSTQPDVLLRTRRWWLAPPVAPAASARPASWQALEVLSSRIHSDHVIAQFRGIDERDASEALKGYSVWVSRAQFPAADQEEYYWVDLIGCELYGQQDGQPELMGVVREVSDNGAHAVLHVEQVVSSEALGEGVKPSKPKLTLVPFVQAHVRSVDLAARRIDTDWPADF
ncbi:ribosome maturation factor RimM [Pusillimonas sp. CC-YST705]|uniref:Ribosome maturation factor RimM n=1 Tax=Mesopusillimonas faecipullorum TaxID=2755040 RepID=A0ABS8CA65_9BURK|nr:ribosome maturation factor RimM [Mesopusillimonas faecipullorum]MCB5362931.1 ribosome maturation factor RimM [Mesopusillimonas faecipullorum]